uniref:DNA-directed RNA polymerase n=1 Tax=viral metagenome TaxID=1070528 RepID=A0A6C0EE33_9ZZZZ
MDSSIDKNITNLIDLYFNQPKILYQHLFSSYHQFIEEIIPYLLIKEPNNFYENIDKEKIYLHGFKCSNIRLKPSVFENDNEIKFPSDARKNHLNYFGTIIADVQQYVEINNSLTDDKIIKNIGNLEKDLPIANIPIMVKSKYCSTNIKKDLKGECPFDGGGYFIVNGQEKIVMSIEKMVDNKILVFSKKDNSYPDGLIYTAQINSKKNDWSENLQILTIKNRKDGVLSISTSSQLVDIPLFILMRALGIDSDRSIISHITYDLEDDKMLNLLRPSVSNSIDEFGNNIKTKNEAIEYLILKIKKNKRISQSNDDLAKIQKKSYLDKILKKDLLPHLGEDIPKKIVFLGLMANKLLNVMLGRNTVDDRDALQNKRIEHPGVLLGQLFRQNWKKLLNEIAKHFKKKNQSDETPILVLGQIKPSTIEQGLKTALSTGVWGMNRTKKGVAQSLQRLSWIQGYSYGRRILSPSMDESTAKVTSIRQVNPNQCQMLCCLTGDTEILMGNQIDIKMIKDIVKTDIVNTVNPITLKQEPSKIYNIFSRMSEKLFEIKTSSNRIIKVTHDHPLLVNKNGKLEWINAENLQHSDYLIIRHTELLLPKENININLNINNYIFNKDNIHIIARLFGYFYNSDLISYDINNLDILNDIKLLNIYDDFKNIISELKSTNINWIIDNSMHVKREFLSGLFGSIKNNKSDQIDEFYYFYFSPAEKFIEKNIDIIAQLFQNFNIKTVINDNKLSLNNSIKNIIKYGDYIGYRYNENDSRELGYLIEYYKLITYSDLKISYKNFIDTFKINDMIFTKIKSIKRINQELVYDFTTVSNNHSFIANSIVSSNCGETPEGAKIGIVKSLAMMASVTVQNSSQFDVLINLLKENKHIKHPFDVDPLQMRLWVKIFANGNWIGICKLQYANDIYSMLKKARYDNFIDKYTSILFDYSNNEIKIYFDGGRLIRPLLIVHNNKLNITEDVIKDIIDESNKNDKTKSWNMVLNKYSNLIEYEDIESLNYLLVAENMSRLAEAIEASTKLIESTEIGKINRYGDYRWVNYTHCDFHSWVMLGTVIANIPFSNHNYANRNIIHFSQAKQSIGTYLSSHKDRMDISQILYHPQIPLVTTQAMKYNGCLDLPYGENAIVAICSYTGFNQEDSIIFNQSAIDRGIFRADTVRKYHSEILKNPSTSQDDIFTKPDRNKVTSMKQGNYDKLNEKGYIPEETIINNEDIIIGKISPIQPTGNNNKVYKDNSEIFKSNVQGVIDRVHTGIYNAEGYEMYNVKVRMERKPITGDKFTCYDDSHDVLTTDGWINIKDITTKHRVASLVDNKLVYQYPDEIQSYDYEGDMYLVESNQVSLCVTPNHRMWVSKRDKKYKVELAENILHQRRHYKKNVDDIVVDRNDEYFKYDEKNNITHFKIEDLEFDIKDWLMFFGIWIAEGHVDKYSLYPRIAVHKDRVKDIIYPFCDNFNLTYSLYKDHPTAEKNMINISNKKLGNYLFEYSVGAINKYLPKWTWNLTPDLCKILINGMMLGDGHTMENGTRRYDTSSLKLADDFQRLCLHAGYATNISLKYKAGHSTKIKTGKNVGKTITSNVDAYRMTIIETQVEPLVNKNIKKIDDIIENNHDSMIPFNGKIYCCSVKGNGVICVRRCNSIVWCGNSRHGQKGTVGITYKQIDMPFTESGIVPDLILNPHGYPTRMSLGHFIECLASKEAAETGHFVDGTPFNNYDVKQLPEALKKLGYSPYGTEKMYCGLTGRMMDVEIFMGPVYKIRLKHMVLDKVHGRARGPKQALTRQPLEGRSRDGGLKIGEMEKDAMVAHGMSQFLKERLMETSDISKVYVCDDCGMFASKVIDKEYYRCKGCHNSTRISAVVIPHAAKLLFQELTSVNILPRIRTEKSVYGEEMNS